MKNEKTQKIKPLTYKLIEKKKIDCHLEIIWKLCIFLILLWSRRWHYKYNYQDVLAKPPWNEYGSETSFSWFLVLGKISLFHKCVLKDFLKKYTLPSKT